MAEFSGSADDAARLVRNSSRRQAVNKITVSVPLFVRLLEWAHEDVAEETEGDLCLHKLTERAVASGKACLDMADYKRLTAGLNDDD